MKKTRKQKVPTFTRQIVSDNVERLMQKKFSESPNKPKALAAAADTAFSSVQRALSGVSGISVDLLEQLASALDVLPYQLLIPGLDANNPQIVMTLSQSEKALYERLLSATR